MCPNDWEWGGLSWSINFDCLPNDYSSANNSAAACACTDTNMIHGGFPLRATVWFSRCRTPTRDRYLRGGGGGGGFTAISLAFYLSFKSFQAWCDNSAAGVRERGWWSWARMMWTWERSEEGWRKSSPKLRRRAPGSSWASWATRCGCRWHHRVRWQHLYLLHYRQEARTITALFICNPFHLQTTSDTRTQLNK